MLIGILGDIHGNIDALKAILEAMERLSVNKIYCTGDIVGYGGAPAECIELIQKYNIPTVCGNHDSLTLHPEQIEMHPIRPEAKEALQWTRKHLSADHLKWLESLPLEVDTGDFLVTHASCQPYPSWIYVNDTVSAATHLLFQPRPLCFTGHSHLPLLLTHTPGHPLSLELLQNQTLPENATIMVSVGAVGQPRDEDPRACAVIYNNRIQGIHILRVKYDIRKAQQRILDNHLPPFLATRLAQGK